MAGLDDSMTASRSREWMISAMFLAGTAAVPAQSAVHNITLPSRTTISTSSESQEVSVRVLDDKIGDFIISSEAERANFIESWEPETATPDWYFEIADRIGYLATKASGWKGNNSAAMVKDVENHAYHFLSKLELEGVDRAPSVGLDYEGTISFTWLDNDLQADLTIYEDGTYSYFASSGERTASADEARLSDAFDGHFLSLLLV